MSQNIKILRQLINEEQCQNSNLLDVSTLLTAAGNVDIDIEHISNASLSEDIINALQELNLSTSDITKFCEKLTEYRYIDQIHMLHKGKHIRWSRRTPSTETKIPILTNGGIVVDIKFLDNGIYILCKNGIRFIQFRFDDCLVFQKMSADEMLVLSCCDILRNQVVT